jgi:large subunit ribosomal protein L13
MKTVVVKPHEIERQWRLIDASETTLGRLSSVVASLLIGKTKPSYSPNQDHGDNVVVINAAKVKLSGDKFSKKTYFRHSGYPGAGKRRTVAEQMSRDPRQVVIRAVRGMMPRNTKLGRAMLTKLHVYNGEEHPHAAQAPEPFSVVQG